MAPIYGQIVAGPPGCGKTTFCNGMQEYLRLLGRNACVVNLDPANETPKKPLGEDADNVPPGDYESLPYDALLDVCDSVVNLSSVMKQLNLGPNGGLVYCMEYLEAHVDDVVELIQKAVQEDSYLIFDLPGQVELYTHGTAVPTIIQRLTEVLDLRLVGVQLVDSHYCTEPANFLSAALLSTTTMLRLELPMVSILSKVDLLVNYGPLPLSLEYFTDCQELDRLLPFLQGNQDENEENFDMEGGNYADDPDYQRARQRTRLSPFFRKHEKLHRALAEVVEDFGLLSFLPLDISNAESVGRVLARIDKANGYIFVDPTKHSKAQDVFQCAVQAEPMSYHYEGVADVQERIAEAKAQRNESSTGGAKANHAVRGIER